MNRSPYDRAVDTAHHPHPSWCVIEEAHSAEDCSREPSAQMKRNIARAEASALSVPEPDDDHPAEMAYVEYFSADRYEVQP